MISIAPPLRQITRHSPRSLLRPRSDGGAEANLKLRNKRKQGCLSCASPRPAAPVRARLQLRCGRAINKLKHALSFVAPKARSSYARAPCSPRLQLRCGKGQEQRTKFSYHPPSQLIPYLIHIHTKYNSYHNIPKSHYPLTRVQRKWSSGPFGNVNLEHASKLNYSFNRKFKEAGHERALAGYFKANGVSFHQSFWHGPGPSTGSNPGVPADKTQKK